MYICTALITYLLERISDWYQRKDTEAKNKCNSNYDILNYIHSYAVFTRYSYKVTAKMVDIKRVHIAIYFNYAKQIH